MTTQLRRNGKLSSCEPCRKSKLRCDHTQPQCGRCKRRGLASNQCFYHPAPMTRQRTSEASDASTTPPVVIDRDQIVSDDSSIALSGPQDHEAGHATGLLGMYDCSSPLVVDIQKQFLQRSHASLDQHGVAAPTSQSEADEEHVNEGTRLLDTILQLTSNLDEGFVQWSTSWDEHSIIGPIEGAAWRATHEALLFLRESRTSDTLYARARTITRCTKLKVRFPSSAADKALYRTFRADALRWEIVGMYCARIGIYLGCGRGATPMQPMSISAAAGRDSKIMLDKAFLACMDCAALCAALGQVNDLTLFMLSKTITLATWCCGDDSYNVWRLGGEMASAIYALKYHQARTIYKDAPIYLAELRKRVIGQADEHDKHAALFMGRPPRLVRQYCDIALPLDLSNAALEEPTESLQSAIAMLDADGWNCSNIFYPASWQRVRLILSPFREEVLEISFGSNVPDMRQRAESILHRYTSKWRSLPDAMDLMPDWGEVPWLTSVQRLFTRLDYLYTQFLLLKVLVGPRPEQRTDLLLVAHRILTLVLASFKQRYIITTLRLDMEWMVSIHRARSYRLELEALIVQQMVFYAMPCASVLLWEYLEWTPPAGVSVPSRATLLRDIQTLVICCDWLVECGESNYALCRQAQTVFSKGLDFALNNNTRSDRAAEHIEGAGVGQPAITRVDEVEAFAQDPDWTAWLETLGLQSDSWLDIDLSAA